jgi:hypothetical protein
MALYLVGNVVNATGLSMTPQSIFAALGTVGLVTNAVNSRFILKETLNRTIIAGTGIVIVGSCLAVLFGAHPHESSVAIEMNVLTEYFSAHAFLVYLCTIFSTIGMLLLTLKRTETESLDSTFMSIWKLRFLSIAYPLIAGMVGSFTALFAKSAISLAASHNSFRDVRFYLMVAGVLIPGITQIHLLNMGLKKYDQILVIPVFAVSLEIFSIMCGIIFFQEYHLFSTLSLFLFPCFVCLTFFGVAVISIGQRQKKMKGSDALLLGASSIAGGQSMTDYELQVESKAGGS